MKFNSNIIKLDNVESTNSYALRLIKKQNVIEGTVVWTKNQTKGRGQRENYWESEKDMNLTFSLILSPKFLAPVKQFYLSKAISIALVEYLCKYFDNVKIKWPNDIYVKNNKISGILIENIIKGQSIENSIIGIGININQSNFISKAPNPISMYQLSNRKYDIETELKNILSYLNLYYIKLMNGDFNLIDKLYDKYMYRLNSYHWYEYNGKQSYSMICGTDKIGKLILLNNKNQYLRFNFKEVKFIL